MNKWKYFWSSFNKARYPPSYYVFTLSADVFFAINIFFSERLKQSLPLHPLSNKVVNQGSLDLMTCKKGLWDRWKCALNRPNHEIACSTPSEWKILWESNQPKLSSHEPKTKFHKTICTRIWGNIVKINITNFHQFSLLILQIHTHGMC